MLFLLMHGLYAASLEDDTPPPKEQPIMVVGSYLGGMWLLHHKKDSIDGSNAGTNSLTYNIPAIVAGYGDVFAKHFYWGLEGSWGYGLKRPLDSNQMSERARWHMSILGHLGFYLSPVARIYGLIGTDKTTHVRQQDLLVNGKATTKTIAEAAGFTWVFGSGLLITLSSRFGFGVEGRYMTPKNWTFPDAQNKLKVRVSAWQMGVKAVIFI